MIDSPSAPLLAPNTRWQNVIIVTSVLIPIVVAILLYLPYDARIEGLDVSFLPHLNAILNTATAVSLSVSLWAILRGNIATHKLANTTAFFLSSIFLVSYVVYHYATPPTYFGDADFNGMLTDAEKAAAGTGRTVYVSLLLLHILAAAVVVPFVLFSMYYSLSGQFAKHKKLSRITWPVWFFVAVSGVVVYLLIRPYYGA